jgi:hypothetical protein
MPINTSGIALADRVKELSYSTGTSNLTLDGSAAGFSSFSDLYSSGDVVFYAATDGVSYEVGSGIFHTKSAAPDELERICLVSTNSNSKVNWGASVKEVFVTYPADFSVYTASGLSSEFKGGSESGVAFWQTNNILNYDADLVWDKENNRLGVANPSPEYAIDISGSGPNAQVRASGAIVGSSGVLFPGGRQTEHFLRTDLIDGNGGLENTNIGELIQLSGVVDQYLGLVKQEAGQFLAGPPSGCEPGCSPEFPSFRQIVSADIPPLNYITQRGDAKQSGVAIFHESGVIAYDANFIWDSGANRLGINISNPQYPLSVDGDALVSGDIHTQWVYVSGIHGLTAGSGLELTDTTDGRKLKFDISDVFTVSSSGGSGSVRQADTVLVSGVSGVKAVYSYSGTTHKVTIDANELSGVLSTDIASKTYNAGSGLSVSNNTFHISGVNTVERYDFQYPSGGAIWNHVSGVSGYLPNTAESGIVLSGVDGKQNTIILSPPKNNYLNELTAGDMNVSGGGDRVLVYDMDENKWEWAELASINTKFGSATGGEVNEFSYQFLTVNSGEDDSYWQGQWGTTRIRAQSKTDSLHFVAGSGVTLNTRSGSSPAQSGLRIAVPMVGVSGVSIEHNFNGGGWTRVSGVTATTTDPGVVMLYNSAHAVSDPSNDTKAVTMATVSALSGHLQQGSFWDGNLFSDSGIHLPSGNFAQHGNQNYSVVIGPYHPDADIGTSNQRSVIIGASGAVGAQSNTSTVMIGELTGHNANTNHSAVMIGLHAGSGLQNSERVIAIGEEAGNNANDADGTIFIGQNATGNSKYSVYIGAQAGGQMQGSGNIEIVGGDNVDLDSTGGDSTVPTSASQHNMINIGNTILGSWADKKLSIGSGVLAPVATLQVNPANSASVGIAVSGQLGQSVDLQRWINSTGSVATSVDVSGILIFDTPILSGLAPNKSIFIDSTSNKFTFKNNTGDCVQLESTSDSTYTPPSILNFTGSSGTLGITSTASFGGFASDSIASPSNQYIRCHYNQSEPYITINVPNSSFWNPSIGTEVIFEQASGVNVSVLPSGGSVAINSAYTRTSAGQYSVLSIKKIDTNTWTLTGDVQ